MMRYLCSILIFVSVIINQLANGFKAGAPVFSCKTMTPGHGVGPQSTAPPYTITTLSAQTVHGRIKVQLFARSGYFSGFLLQARSSSSDDAIGSFVEVPDDAIFLDCGSNERSAVTHKDDRRKKSVEVEWEAPIGFHGSVIFTGTLVYNYTTFWIRVESLPVEVMSKSSDKAGLVTEEAKQLKAVESSLYSGCGITRNCVASPNSCIASENCVAAVAVSEVDGAYQFEMFARKSKYVAAGLSDDNLMGGDSVVECVPEVNGIRSYRSWNVPNHKQNIRSEEQNGISFINGLFLDGSIYCKIRVDPVLVAKNVKFDLNNEEYYLLLAAGTEIHESGVGYHDVVFTTSKDKRRLLDVKPVQDSDSYYDGCNVIKNCFGFPPGCVNTKNCKAVTSVTVQGRKYLFEMQAKDAAYVATGLSDDAIMGGDDVVECVRDVADGGIIKAYRSWNIPDKKKNIRLGPYGINLISGEYVDNNIRCRVFHDEIVAIENQTYDLSKDSYYLLLASGSSVEPTSVGFHDLVYSASAKSSLLRDVQSVSGNTNNNVFYSGCGSVKSCFGVPSGCVSTQSCRAVVSVTPKDNHFIFHLEATDVAYVAVGISDDPLMGGDSVVECVRDDNDRIRAYLSYNVPGQKNNTRIQSQSVVTLENGTYSDGKIHCSIMHEPVYKVEGQSFDLMKEEYILLLAAGSSVRSNNVGYHDIIFSPSAEKRVLSDVAEFSSATKLLLHLHGSFMVVAWIGTASLGILLARYYKQTWVGSSFCGKDIWFAWHRFFMVVTWLLTLSAVAIMYYDLGGFVTGPGQTHALLGAITTLLTFIQPIAATFRPHPESSRRPIFNWLHWFIGNAAHIVAIVTIFLAVDLNKAQLPKWTDWLLAAYVIFYVIVHLILSISGCMSEKSGAVRINAFPMKDINSSRNPPNQQYERRKDSAYSGFRKFMLVIYFLTVAAFATVLVLLIVYAPVTM